MKLHKILLSTVLGLTLPLLAIAAPFGNDSDIAYASKVWKASVEAGFVGDNAIITRPYKGMPPHGLILELMEKDVTIDEIKAL